MKKIIKWIIVLLTIGACVGLAIHFNLFGDNATLTSIELDKQIQTEYHLNDQINLNGAKIIATYSNDTFKYVEITHDMITGFDSASFGTRTLTITYEEKTIEVEYSIVKQEQSVSLVGNIITRYKVGETLDINNAKLHILYNDNSSQDVDIVASMITGFDSSTIGSKTLTITSSEGKTLAVSYTIFAVSKIELIGNIKTEYYISDNLDTNNAKILVTYTDSQTEQVNLTQDMITGFDSASFGTRTLTITYEEKTIEIEYSVVTNVTKIELTKTIQTSYQINDSIQLNGAKLLVSYNDNSSVQIDIENSMITGFNTTSIGQKTLTFTYGEKSTTVDYTVNIQFGGYLVSKYEHYDNSGTKLYETNYTSIFDTNAMYINIKENNIGELIQRTENDFSEPKSLTWSLTTDGKFVLVISYDSMGTDTVSFLYDDGVLQQIAPSDVAQTQDGYQLLTLTYFGVATKSISLASNITTEYKLDDSIQLSGTKLLIKKTDGSTSQIDVAEQMITGFDSSTINQKTLTITYDALTISVDYNVSFPYGEFILTQYDFYNSEESHLGTKTVPNSKLEETASWIDIKLDGTVINYIKYSTGILEVSGTWSFKSNRTILITFVVNGETTTQTLTYSNGIMYSGLTDTYDTQYGNCKVRATLKYINFPYGVYKLTKHDFYDSDENYLGTKTFPNSSEENSIWIEIKSDGTIINYTNYSSGITQLSGTWSLMSDNKILITYVANGQTSTQTLTYSNGIMYSGLTDTYDTQYGNCKVRATLTYAIQFGEYLQSKIEYYDKDGKLTSTTSECTSKTENGAIYMTFNSDFTGQVYQTMNGSSVTSDEYKFTWEISADGKIVISMSGQTTILVNNNGVMTTYIDKTNITSSYSVVYLTYIS